MLGVALDEIPPVSAGTRYVVTASCDENYFRLYGAFLVSSFAKFCSGEATLVLTVITSDVAPLMHLLESWGPVNVVLQPVNIRAGPMADRWRRLLGFVGSIHF